MGHANANDTVKLKSAGSNGLPDGWADTTIGEAFQLNPRKVPADALPSGAEVTFVPMPAVDADSGAISCPELREFGAVRNGYTSFVEDDVIVAKITPCMENGKAAIARGLKNGHGFGSTEFHVLRATGAALPEYVYYFVRQESFRREAESRMTGSVGQKRVPPTFLGQHSIPLPPLAEQKRIVAKVEALLERVVKARERLDRVPGILNKFRQSVLAAACSGRLSADWREENSKADLSAFVAEIGSLRKERYKANNSTGYRASLVPRLDRTFEFPEEWPVVSMDYLTCLVTSGSRGWAKYYSDEGPLFVRAQNINTDELVLDDAARVTPPDTAEGRRTRIQKHDLLITITGANVTKSAVVPRDIGEAYVSQHVAIARPVDNRMSVFLFLWLISPAHGREKLTADAYGAGKPGLNLTNIRDMPIALPSLEEQQVIVCRVGSLLALADRVEKNLAIGTRNANRIAQSVVAKAFAGELVETEAELARRGGRDYEPASALLERISGRVAATVSAIQVERGRAVLDILLLLEAWKKPASISALEPALVLMRNDAARQTLLSGAATPRQRRSLSNAPTFVRGLDVIYQGLEANGAIRRVGQSGFELVNSQLLAKATATDRTRAAEVVRAIQTLSNLRSLPKVVAAITNVRYEITV